MRLYHYFSVLLTTVSFMGFGQKLSSCSDESYSAIVSIPEMYRKGDLLGIDSILSRWESSCGRTPLAIRIETLRNMEAGQYADNMFDFSEFSALLFYIEDERFKMLMDSVHENPRQLYLSYFKDPDEIFTFNDFTISLAKSILEKHQLDPPCSTQNLILDAYSDNFDTFFTQLKDPNCQAAPANLYRSTIRSLQRKPLVDANLFIGTWLPSGNLKLLGWHPLIGFCFGLGSGKFVFDSDFEFRFIRSPNEYTVQYKGAPTITSSFFSGSIDLDTGYPLIGRERSRLYAMGAIGFEGIDAIETKDEQDGKSLNALDLNAGFSWRSYSRDGSYWGLDVRHHFVGYKNNGGTSIDGTSASVRLVAGLLKNDKRKRGLDYFKRISQ